ncbi:unnamed protein product [Didymodactylos carnosus]|uniref:Ras-related protein Rab n=1 Tax=Didymodactylos carnosus TaxID=1234261 RepID=A0A813WYN9_9BILA|nr:unnamed protein product [Didymodactylos carnosus]CAF1094106.1 unnamed protein product [Didymodactylos carnosus]CAF3651540.1 unnamed protein product [Didymodactylos carnosus]CAF3855589.1 unnamed protein product [Didymodactylos carnosus]
MTEQKSEPVLKVLIVGDLGTGKTSIVKRYVENYFSEYYKATIGCDFALKVLKWTDDQVIRLQLWDISGHERLGSLTRIYYKDAVGCLLVFDMHKPTTFDGVLKWKNDLDNKVQLSDGTLLPCVLLANKCDLPKQDIVTDIEQMDDFCRVNGICKWFETSAKKNLNIETSIRYLIGQIMKNENQIENKPNRSDTLNIRYDEKLTKSKNKIGCCTPATR